MKNDVISIVIVVIFVLEVLIGFKKGLVKAAADFLGMIIGIYLAFLLYKPMGSFVANFFPGMSLVLRNVIGFIAVYILANILLQIIQSVLGVIMKLPGLSLINRILGGLFSFVKTYVVIGLIVAIVFSMGLAEINDAIIGSKLGMKMLNAGKSIYVRFENVLPSADDLIPKDWNIDFFLDRFNSTNNS